MPANDHLKRPLRGIPAPLAAFLLIGVSSFVVPHFQGCQAQPSDLRTVTSGKARFSALAPSLVRLEYSPSGRFVDDLSISVINREGWPAAVWASEQTAGWLTLRSGKIVVRYKTGSGAFGSENLQINWSDGAGERSWKPGDNDDKNLGGVPGDMAGLVTPVTNTGPLSRNGYFLLDDSHTALRDKATAWVKLRPDKDGQDWYFLVYGQDYKRGLEDLAKLIGPSPLVPRYVLGAWFGSRAGYSDQEWKMIVKRFRDESLPLDMVVLDSDSTTKVIWAGYDWDAEQMPDPKGFFRWMRQRGVKVTVNEHYGALTKDNDSNFETIRQALGLPAGTKEIGHDLANPKYARLFMDLLHKPALDMGMAFWWQDGCAGANMPGLDPMLWTREIEYEGTERITGLRAFDFCRLGVWGSHRYGAFFTGDLPGEWACLKVIVPATVQGGNMLVTYMNNLCGGVGNVNLPAELYRRWVQFGAFSPILWFHGLWGLRLPWEYGPEGVDTYRKFVELRYALIPYTYTCSRIAHETGLPLVRGTCLEYPNQEPAYSHPHQYLFGKEFLVAPVVEPTQGKPALKEVYLPAGEHWFDFFTGDIYAGGRGIIHECPIERMPLFVRAGSIIPLAPKMDYTDQKPLDPLTLEVFGGPSEATFELYEDDGLSLEYRDGRFVRSRLTFGPSQGNGDYRLAIGPLTGSYTGKLETRRYVVRVHGLLKPESVAVNGRQLNELDSNAGGEGWTWDGKQRATTVTLTRPLATAAENAILLKNAGTFAQAVALQQAINLRAQMRQVNRALKLKWVALTGGADIKKPPRVILEADEVERELDGMVDEPRPARQPPDFDGLRQRVLAALTGRPFDSTRAIPEIDPEALATTRKIENAQFTPAEIDKLKAILRGAGLPAWLHPAD
ncbi:MAG: TIM-barrel domain-containing protein [Verrucomicrobiota bacterium]|jgi:hypothetical protein